jgi:hypothetical protein
MIIFILIITFYTIYLNIRIRDFEQYVENELDDLHLQQEDNKLKLYNKMMEWRKEIKNEKSRRRSTKSSSKVSKTKVSKD